MSHITQLAATSQLTRLVQRVKINLQAISEAHATPTPWRLAIALIQPACR